MGHKIFLLIVFVVINTLSEAQFRMHKDGYTPPGTNYTIYPRKEGDEKYFFPDNCIIFPARPVILRKKKRVKFKSKL